MKKKLIKNILNLFGVYTEMETFEKQICWYKCILSVVC